MEVKILSLLVEIEPMRDFTQSIDFINDGFLDSIGVISLVGLLESEFYIDIDGDDIIPENFINIDAIVRMINKYTAK